MMRHRSQTIPDTDRRTKAVAMKAKMLGPVLLSCWTFMPKMEEARLSGRNVVARIVTGID